VTCFSGSVQAKALKCVAVGRIQDRMNAVTTNVVALAQDSNVGRRHLAVMVTTEVEPRRQCVPTQEPGYRKSGAGGC